MSVRKAVTKDNKTKPW